MSQPIQFDEVADVYDDYVTADFDIPFFLNEAKKCHGKVLELMAGTGRVSLPLLQAGIDLTCIDYAPGMLNVLQRKLTTHRLSCPVHCMDAAELSLADRFDLIFIPFHSFSEILERPRQEEALRRIHAHLTETGRFLCTLQNPALRAGSIDGTLRTLGRFPTRSGSLVVRSQLEHGPSPGYVHGKQFYEQYDNQGRLQRAFELTIHFCLHTKTEFKRLIYAADFETEILYGDYAYSPFDESTSQFMIWKLRKSTP